MDTARVCVRPEHNSLENVGSYHMGEQYKVVLPPATGGMSLRSNGQCPRIISSQMIDSCIGAHLIRAIMRIPD